MTLAMQLTAMADPQFLRTGRLTTEAALAKEREIYRASRAGRGQAREGMLDKITEGRMNKYLRGSPPLRATVHQGEHHSPCIADLIKTKIAKLGENITVSRFVRFKVGDTGAAETPAAE